MIITQSTTYESCVVDVQQVTIGKSPSLHTTYRTTVDAVTANASNLHYILNENPFPLFIENRTDHLVPIPGESMKLKREGKNLIKNAEKYSNDLK